MSKDQGFFVYAMLCDGEHESFVKIGKSRCIAKRIKAVQTGCPLPIHTVMKLSYPDAAAMDAAERSLHRDLYRYQTCGEWFSFDFADERDAGRFEAATKSVLPEGQAFWELIPIGQVGSGPGPRYGGSRYARLSGDPVPPAPVRPSDTMSLEAYRRHNRGLQPLFWSGL